MEEVNQVKKVIVSTVSTRKFVEDLLYLGSVGGKLSEGCVAIKGLFLRTEVEIPADAVFTPSPEMVLAAGPAYTMQAEEKPARAARVSKVKPKQED